MNTSPSPALHYDGSAVEGQEWSVLTEIFDPDINLALMSRRVSPAVVAFAHALLAARPHLQLRTVLAAGEKVTSMLPDWLQALPGAKAWCDDLQQLVDAYQCLFDPPAIGLRLHGLDDVMCPRFHVDRVPVRLVTTYVGPATDWIRHQDACRGDGHGPLPPQDEQVVRAMPTGAVALMKGEAWDGNEGRGLVHRSPSVPAGQRRLVLTLDWLSD
ncbi:MAG: DUF1826 domain-containing protein [Marinobacter sp.]|nr:DUF1826 domain-containing protein [Marinobacter sp.]